MKRSPQAAGLALALRLFVRPSLRWSSNVALARRALRWSTKRQSRMPKGVSCAPVVIEGEDRPYRALRVTPADAKAQPIVHFHGGGYIAGAPETHLGLAAALARKSGHPVLLPELPLAPENPYPAAFEAGLGFWQALRNTGHLPAQLAFGGDSAGGGLALALAAHLEDEGPAAVYGLSPWCDLTFSSESIHENRRLDPMFPAERAAFLADLVLQGKPGDDPRISPVFARPESVPPLWLSVSDTELIRDDAWQMAEIWRRAGQEVTIMNREGLVHAWPFFAGLPEAKTDIASLAQFLQAKLASAPMIDKSEPRRGSVSTESSLASH